MKCNAVRSLCAKFDVGESSKSLNFVWLSNHPTQHKISCIRTLFNRAETHCNTTEAKTKELNHLYKTFAKNSYPKRFIDSVYKRKLPPKNTQQNDTSNQRIPYIHKISSPILNKLHLKVAHKPANKLKSAFTKHKDPQTTLTNTTQYT